MIGAQVDRITVDLVDDLAFGAGLLAAGGVQPWPAVEPLRAAMAEHGGVALVDVAELPADAFVLPVGMATPGVGAGTGFSIGRAVRRLLRTAERRRGHRCAAVVPIEIGGMGALAALHAAATLGLPCVDGDGARRGFSRLDLTLFSLGGLAAAPALVSDRNGNLVTVESTDDHEVHRLVLANAEAMGGTAVVAAYPMTAGECRRTVAGGSLRYCLGLGRLARAMRAPVGRTSGDRLAAHDATLLFTGRIVHVARNGPADAIRGTATVETVAAPTRTMRIDFQHGNLVASEDGVVYATVPDLISLVDVESWVPAHTAGLAPGQHVHVIAIPADDRWRGAAGIAAAGPRQFGYDIDYEPLEAARSDSITESIQRW